MESDLDSQEEELIWHSLQQTLPKDPLEVMKDSSFDLPEATIELETVFC